MKPCYTGPLALHVCQNIYYVHCALHISQAIRKQNKDPKRPGHVNFWNGYKSEKGDLPYNTLAAAGYSPALLSVMPGASWR